MSLDVGLEALLDFNTGNAPRRRHPSTGLGQLVESS